MGVDVGVKRILSLPLNALTVRSRKLSDDYPWCSYCDGACGIGVYTLENHPGLVFCEKECRDNFLLGRNHGEEPDVVY